MAVQVPTPDQLRAVADEMGLSLTGADIESFISLMRPSVAAYNVVDAIPDNLPAVKYPRTPGYRPQGEENRHNAWYVKTVVEGAPNGKLKGKTVVLNDNIMLAGVPMMNGASTLEGYVPDVDATVVHRILDAGGTIVGKAHCEYYCLPGGSHTCAAGPVHNPHKMGYSAGGSSSGSAVLVSLGQADMALGGDQGIHPDAVIVLQNLRHETDARTRSVYRQNADRDLCGPHGSDHRHGRRQRAAP